MECNKEEAVRAKEIAELKLESRDYVGARKFAFKAQQLYPDLDNISQLVCVCDVHYTAQHKMVGNERDWYSILQVELTADEITIKKQYRKLALLLHPDKNKISGAEAAFKLIGEAQGVLLDKEKRAFHDMKRRTFKPAASAQSSQRTSGNVKVRRQPEVNYVSNGATVNLRNANPQPPCPQTQSVAPNGRGTFWTICPFCAVRYQYYVDVLNRALRCQSCKKPFMAYDIGAHGVHMGTNAVQHPSFQQIPNQNASKYAATEGLLGEQNSQRQDEAGSQKTSSGHRAVPEVYKDRNAAAPKPSREAGSSKTSAGDNVVPEVYKDGSSAAQKPSTKVTGKKSKKQVIESSESFDSGSTEMVEGSFKTNKDGGICSHSFGRDAETQPRRSARSKQQVCYNEDEPVSQKTSSDDKEVSEVYKDGSSGASKPSTKVTGKKRKKQVVESSESYEFGSIEMEEDTGKTNEDGDIFSHRIGGDAVAQPHKSTQSKEQVSYNECIGDDGNLQDPLERSKAFMDKNFEDISSEKRPYNLAESADETVERAEIQCQKEEVENYVQRSSEADHACTSNSSSKVEPEPELHDVVDPDFNDFDNERKQESFEVGQFWAVYDTVDAMPRFYAWIRKVFRGGFKVRITWLEPDPVDEDEIEWVDRDLPFSCGKFRLGHSENTKDHLMFSHIVTLEKGGGRHGFKIYPRKGETWALFKDWDITWDSCSERKYKYDYVEVLSNYDGVLGVHVVYLEKLKGFTCVFARKLENELQISPRELLRFSHRVPSFKLTGDEQENVPRGSFELDPAAISISSSKEV